MNYYQINQYLIKTKLSPSALEAYKIVSPGDESKGFYYMISAPLETCKALNAWCELADDWHHYESLNQFEDKLNSSCDDSQLENAIGIINWEWIQQLSLIDQSSKGYEAYFKRILETTKEKWTLHLLGLGDVGLTLSIGLKLLGAGIIGRIGLFDINPAQRARMKIELSQIIVNTEIEIVEIDQEDLFEGDIFVFCASKYVPKVGEKVDDVRMMQLDANAGLIKIYAKMAREKGFEGVFAVVSDPVDLLCKAAFDYSNQDETGQYDYKGLLPDQIVGFGLGVMYGRALYYGGQAFKAGGRVYGPHGKDLIVANHKHEYDDAKSLTLTEQVINANLVVRDLGYKPYIAPAISSGASSITEMLRGNWHYSARFLGGSFWGMYNYWDGITHFENSKLPPALMNRLKNTYERLSETWQTFNA